MPLFTTTTIPKGRLAILLGLLSMLYGEVDCGSSTLWMIQLWFFIVTFPLYMFHSLFYLNLAQRTRRTSLPHLYFWGILFALYEAPITKVLFSGYVGTAGPGWGLVGGVAIMEFLMIVLFWHPVMSFMMPILALQMMLQGAAKDASAIFPSHLPILEWTRKSKTFFIGITIITSVLMAYADMIQGLQPDIVLGATIGLVAIAKVATPMKGKGYTMPAFRFGNAGFAIVVAYMAWLYIWAIPNIIPPNLAIITPGSVLQGSITLAIVACVVCIALWASGPDTVATGSRPATPQDVQPGPARLMTTRHLVGLWSLLALLVFAWSIVPFGIAFLALVDMLFGIGLPALGGCFVVGMSIGLYRNKKAKTEREK